jgi:nuclear control of ATPase protein 2
VGRIGVFQTEVGLVFDCKSVNLSLSSTKLNSKGSKALPLRLKHVLETIIHTLRARNLAITPSAFTPNSIRQLFPSSLQPSRLAISFFPHLSRHPRVVFRSPFELTRQECQSYRQALQNIRDDRAERLGRLAASRQASLLDTQALVNFIGTLQRTMTDTEPLYSPDQEHALVELLSDINSTILPRTSHLFSVGISALRRPSRLMLVWPRLVAIPPVTFILFRLVCGSRRTLVDQLAQVVDTLSGFWTNYLIQPFKDILDTVRTGGEEGVRIVSQEGVKADMEARSCLTYLSFFLTAW